jgi:hypothetical protein
LLIFSSFSATSNLIFVPTRIVMRSPNLPYQLIPFFTLHLYSLTVIEVCTGVSVGAQHRMFIFGLDSNRLQFCPVLPYPPFSFTSIHPKPQKYRSRDPTHLFWVSAHPTLWRVTLNCVGWARSWYLHLARNSGNLDPTPPAMSWHAKVHHNTTSCTESSVKCLTPNW